MTRMYERLDRDAAMHAHAILCGDTSVKELAEAWNVRPGAIYKALDRHNLRLPQRSTKEHHVTAQRDSGLPPDLYAARQGLAINTLQRYAYEMDTVLAMHSYAAKKAWWANQLDLIDMRHLQKDLIRYDLPLRLVSYWWHKLYGTDAPVQTLLWGFPEVRVVTADQFNDVGRYHNPHGGETHFLGRGKTVVQIDIRLATEIHRHTCAY